MENVDADLSADSFDTHAPATGRLRLHWLIGLILLAVVAAVYSGTASSEFVAYDDPRYIYRNPLVTAGLSVDGLEEAFTRQKFGAWYPLTSISHMLAWEVFGDAPAGHHLVNVALHAANVLLLFALFTRMTGQFWLAAIIAVLFAIHPLHVESVAWVTERKDVLSGFLGLLCLHAYVRYTKRRSALRYSVVFALFALGLLAKSILVTLPCVFLLLDVWPLSSGRPATRRLLWEKLPLFGLSLAAGVAIYLVQLHPADQANATEISLIWRLVNVPISYVAYLGKGFWPVGLACFYPHPGLANPELLSRYVLDAALATFFLLATTGVAVSMRRKRPWLLVGWLWYLGTLVPVVGIVQVGYAALADRFVYLPFIGIYWIVAGAVLELARRQPRARPALVASGIVVIMLLVGVAIRQVGVWKNSRSLFEHAIAVTERNAFVHNNLGVVYFDAGEAAAAEHEFRAAIAIDPSSAQHHHNLGFALETLGKLEQAVASYRRTLEIVPDDFDANYQLAGTLFQLEDYALAANYFERALEARPRSPRARRFLREARQLARDPL